MEVAAAVVNALKNGNLFLVPSQASWSSQKETRPIWKMPTVWASGFLSVLTWVLLLCCDCLSSVTRSSLASPDGAFLRPVPAERKVVIRIKTRLINSHLATSGWAQLLWPLGIWRQSHIAFFSLPPPPLQSAAQRVPLPCFFSFRSVSFNARLLQERCSER